MLERMQANWRSLDWTSVFLRPALAASFLSAGVYEVCAMRDSEIVGSEAAPPLCVQFPPGAVAPVPAS